MTEIPSTPIMVPDLPLSPDGDMVGSPPPLVDQSPLLPPPELPFQTIQHTWIGTDGTEWDLTNPDDGVFLVQENIEGLHHPPMDIIGRQSPMLPGSSFHGYRITERPVVWPLYVYSDESSMHWVELDRALWASLKPGREGTWRVTLPNGDTRQLRMRIQATPQGFERDPVRFGWHKYAVEAVADINPFWTVPTEIYGTKITWRDGAGKDFFNSPTGAPPFHITESSVESIKSYTSPGDEDVWPTITITGPMASVDFRIGEQEFTVACNLNDQTSRFVIVTDPRYFSVTDDRGRNRIRDVTTWSFEPLPAGVEQEISVTPHGDGGGSVVMDVSPLYYRAW